MESFSESIIIPLALFKRCKFQDSLQMDSKVDLLQDNSLGASEKMILYNQRKQMDTFRKDSSKTENVNTNVLSKSHIIDNIATKYRPQVSSILDFIIKHKDVVSWDPTTYEIIIHGSPVLGSNIISVMKFWTLNAVITKAADNPVGADILYDTLVGDLRLPTTWIPATLLRKSARRRVKAKKKLRSSTSSLEGHGWLSYD